MAKLKLYYFTFERSHPLSKHVQPILAKSKEDAMRAMSLSYNNMWIHCYTEKEFDSVSKANNIRIHTLDLIDARKVLLSDYAR